MHKVWHIVRIDMSSVLFSTFKKNKHFYKYIVCLLFEFYLKTGLCYICMQFIITTMKVSNTIIFLLNHKIHKEKYNTAHF